MTTTNGHQPEQQDTTPLPRSQDELVERIWAYGRREQAGAREKRHALLNAFLDRAHALQAARLSVFPPGTEDYYPTDPPGLEEAVAAMEQQLVVVVNAAANLDFAVEALTEAVWLVGRGDVAEVLLPSGSSTHGDGARRVVLALLEAVGRDVGSLAGRSANDPDLARLLAEDGGATS